MAHALEAGDRRHQNHVLLADSRRLFKVSKPITHANTHTDTPNKKAGSPKIDHGFRFNSLQSNRTTLSIKRAFSAMTVETGMDTVVLIWLSRKIKAGRVNGS
jgi:hypothetical protein